MPEEEIRAIVKRYRIISSLWLFGFLLFAVAGNWFLIQSSIDRHFELGLEYTSSNEGYIWGAIIIGLNVVLQLVFYSLEKILLHIHQESGSSS